MDDGDTVCPPRFSAHIRLVKRSATVWMLMLHRLTLVSVTRNDILVVAPAAGGSIEGVMLKVSFRVVRPCPGELW